MTASGDIISAVRSNIYESASDPTQNRTDTEILRWVNQAMFDYVAMVSQEFVPELTKTQTFSGTYAALPGDYLKFHACTVNRAISTGTTSTTVVQDCYLISPGETSFKVNYPDHIGAYCQIGHINGSTALACGPEGSVDGGTLSYVGMEPMDSTSSSTFPLGREHESAVIYRATALALLKLNDADSDKYMSLFQELVGRRSENVPSSEIQRA